MKINSIKIYNNYNLNSANRQKAHGVQVQADKISLNNIQFKGAADVFIGLNENIGIRRQAFELQKEAETVKKKASEITKAGDFRINHLAGKVLDNSRQISAQSKEVLEEAITNIKALKDNGYVIDIDNNITRTFTIDKNGTGVLNELEGDKLVRQSIYNGRELIVFDYSDENSTNYCVFDLKTKQLIEFAQGLKIEGKVRTIENRYCYKDGQLSTYEYKYRTEDKQNKSALDRYVFDDGNLSEFYKNYFKDFKGLERSISEFVFHQNKLVEYKYISSVQEDVGENSLEDYLFQNGVLKSCDKGNVVKYGISDVTKKRYEFLNGEISRVELGVDVDEDSIKRIKQAFDFTSKGKKLFKYTQDFQMDLKQNPASKEDGTSKKSIYF